MQPYLKKPVILCVDDTPNVLEGQKMLLEENGYRVLAATNFAAIAPMRR